MIQRFRHKGLERLFVHGDPSGVNVQFVGKLRRMLTLLENAQNASVLNLPGYRLHQLKGGRKGQWAVTVTGNWRLVFEFDGAHATNVDLADYH
jgi:proteic killer suppression protein